MAISKVILNGVTQMDVTTDTVTADKLLSSYTATKNDGTKITGTFSGGSMNTSTNCVLDTSTYTTLTVSNVQSAPSKFVLVYDNVGSNESIDLYQNCVSSISYDGTTTNAYYIVPNSSSYSTVWKVESGVITWTYSSAQHTLTFSSSTNYYEIYQFGDSTASSGYTLYYS